MFVVWKRQDGFSPSNRVPAVWPNTQWTVDRILTTEARWDDLALQTVFVNRLTEQLKDELALKDNAVGLDSLLSTAIRLDNRLREWRREIYNRPAVYSFSTCS